MATADADVQFYAQFHDALQACIKEHGATYLEAKSLSSATGLVNQGATCYLNSLLQALFQIDDFRTAVFSWRYNAELHGAEKDCIPLALQRLFARLALGAAPFAATSELTTSFGWEGEDAFEQHDVQELCRVLFEALSISDSGNFATLLPSLFGGATVDTLRCDVCGHSRKRTERWEDLSLPVQGMEPGLAAAAAAAAASAAPASGPAAAPGSGEAKAPQPTDAAAKTTADASATPAAAATDATPVGPHSPYTGLHSALRSICRPEVLEGREAWDCEGCTAAARAAAAEAAGADGADAAATAAGGMVKSVRAVKHVALSWPLPPVLTLHLRRFGYDHKTGRYTKVTDPFSFPLVLSGRAFAEPEGQSQASNADDVDAAADAANTTVVSNTKGGDGDDTYELSAVLLHAGGAARGHYLAFVRAPQAVAGALGSSGAAAGQAQATCATATAAGEPGATIGMSAEHARQCAAPWLLANDTSVSVHSGAQVARAIGATLPLGSGATSADSTATTVAGPAAAFPEPKVPAGATPYLLLYSRRGTGSNTAAGTLAASSVATAAGPLFKVLQAITAGSVSGHTGTTAPGVQALARQYGYGRALGAGLLPETLQAAVHADNLQWLQLHRAAQLKPHMTTLAVHLPVVRQQQLSQSGAAHGASTGTGAGAGAGSITLRRTSPGAPAMVSSQPLTVFVRSSATLSEATTAVHGAWAQSLAAATARAYYYGRPEEVQAAIQAQLALHGLYLPSRSGASASASAAGGQGPAGALALRLCRLDPSGQGSGRPGQTFSSPADLTLTVAGAGLAPAATMMLELHPSVATGAGAARATGGTGPTPAAASYPSHHPVDGQGWLSYTTTAITVRLLPWCSHVAALCARTAAVASGDSSGTDAGAGAGACAPCEWSELPVVPALTWDHSNSSGTAAAVHALGPVSTLAHCSVATLVPTPTAPTAADGAQARATQSAGPTVASMLQAMAAVLPASPPTTDNSKTSPAALAVPAGTVHAIIVPGGLPEPMEILDGRASTRLRTRTSPPSSNCTRTGGHAAPGGLRVLSVPLSALASFAEQAETTSAAGVTAVGTTGLLDGLDVSQDVGKALGLTDRDDLVLVLEEGQASSSSAEAGSGSSTAGSISSTTGPGALEAALASIKALFTTTAVRLEVGLAPALASALSTTGTDGAVSNDGPLSRVALARALVAWAGTTPGVVLTLPTDVTAALESSGKFKAKGKGKSGAADASVDPLSMCLGLASEGAAGGSKSSGGAGATGGGKAGAVDRALAKAIGKSSQTMSASGAAATAGSATTISVTARRGDFLGLVKARALALALGGSLSYKSPNTSASSSTSTNAATDAPALPVHLRRGPRAPMFRSSDEGSDRSLSDHDLGDGSSLLLCPGAPLEDGKALVRVWSWVEGPSSSNSGGVDSGSSTGTLALVTAVPAPLTSRVQSLKKALLGALKEKGLLPAHPGSGSDDNDGGAGTGADAWLPGHLRLRTKGAAPGASSGAGAGESSLLRDDGVLRSALPAPAAGGLHTVQALAPGLAHPDANTSAETGTTGQTLALAVTPSMLSPCAMSSTGDERDVVLQLTETPESISRDDMIVRVRQLVLPPTAPLLAAAGATSTTGSKAGAGPGLADQAAALHQQEALLAQLHAVGCALGLVPVEQVEGTDEETGEPVLIDTPVVPAEDLPAWLPLLDLPLPGSGPTGAAGNGQAATMYGPRLTAAEELVVSKHTTARSLAAAVAKQATPGQLALLQILHTMVKQTSAQDDEQEGKHTEEGNGDDEEEDSLVPVPVRLAKMSAHGPAVTVYDATRLAAWSGAVLVSQDGATVAATAESGTAGHDGWANRPLAGPPLGLTDGCTLLWRCDAPAPSAGPAAVNAGSAAVAAVVAPASAALASDAAEDKPWRKRGAPFGGKTAAGGFGVADDNGDVVVVAKSPATRRSAASQSGTATGPSAAAGSRDAGESKSAGSSPASVASSAGSVLSTGSGHTARSDKENSQDGHGYGHGNAALQSRSAEDGENGQDGSESAEAAYARALAGGGMPAVGGSGARAAAAARRASGMSTGLRSGTASLESSPARGVVGAGINCSPARPADGGLEASQGQDGQSQEEPQQPPVKPWLAARARKQAGAAAGAGEGAGADYDVVILAGRPPQARQRDRLAQAQAQAQAGAADGSTAATTGPDGQPMASGDGNAAARPKETGVKIRVAVAGAGGSGAGSGLATGAAEATTGAEAE